MGGKEAKDPSDCNMIQINKSLQIYEYKAFPMAYLEIEFMDFGLPVLFRDPTTHQY
jgi:hypothetical protein